MAKHTYTLEEAKKKFEEKDLILLANEYTGMNTKMPFICQHHKDVGIQYKALSSVVYKDSALKGYRLCGYNRSKKKQINPAKFNEMKILFENAGLILLDSEYKGSKEWYSCRCAKHPEHGEFKKRFTDVKNQNQGCPYCGHQNLIESRRKDVSYYQKFVEDAGYEFVDIKYNHRDEGHTEVYYICPKHREYGVQKKTAVKFTLQGGCPHCSSSRGEKLIHAYLRKNNIDFVPQKTFDKLVGVGGGCLSYDFYIPSLNLLIEFQGIQHEKPIDIFGGETQFAVQREHDLLKRQFATNNNIELLEVWYYDIENIDQILDQYFLLHKEMAV